MMYTIGCSKYIYEIHVNTNMKSKPIHYFSNECIAYSVQGQGYVDRAKILYVDTSTCGHIGK